MARDLSDVYDAIRLAEKEGRTEDVKKLVSYLEKLPAEEPEFDPRDLKSSLGGAATGATLAAVGVPLLKAGVKEASKVGAGVPVTTAFQETPPTRSAFERTIQGGMDEATGTTGRARQTAYNEMTHNVAERAKAQQQVMTDLAKKGVIDPKKLASTIDTGGYGATPTGVLARPEAIAAETKTMPMGQRIRQGVSQLPEKAAAFGRGVSNYRLPIVGSVGPMVGRGLSGAGAGIQATDALNRFNQDDYLGGAISTIGAIGTGTTLFPNPIVKGIGFTIGAGAEGLNAYIDYLKSKTAKPQQEQEPQQEMPVPMAQGGLVGGLDATYNMPLPGGASVGLSNMQQPQMNPMMPQSGLSYFKEGGSTTPAWQRKEGKSPSGGLNAVGRASYKRETGGNLKPPVSSEEAKKSPKKAARRKSFCARMSGNPGPMKDEKGRPTRKALALRKWDC
jgi:hypothetical protein